MVTGRWAIDYDTEDNWIYGNLFIDKTKLTLKLSGYLCNSMGNREFGMVYGELTDGTKITLINLVQTNISHSMVRGRSGVEQTLDADMIIVYHWWNTYPHFESMSFRIPGLEAWLNLQKVNVNSFQNGLPELEVGWGKDIEFNIESLNAKVCLNLRYETNPPIDDPRPLEKTSFRFYPLVQVSITPAYSQSPQWFYDTLFSLKKLLLFICGVRFQEASAEGYLSRQKYSQEILNARSYNEYINLYNHHDCFIYYDEVQYLLPNLIENWFSKVDKLEQVANISYGILANNKMWLHLEYLSLFHALEMFHRNIYGGTYMDEANYVEKVYALTASIPDDLETSHKDALKNRIKYGYEYSLNKRMDELFRLFPSLLRASVFDDRKKFPRIWINTRNYYTHWDETGDVEILNDNDLLDATKILKKFLRILILLQIDVPESTLDTASRRKTGISARF